MENYEKCLETKKFSDMLFFSEDHFVFFSFKMANDKRKELEENGKKAILDLTGDNYVLFVFND